MLNLLRDAAKDNLSKFLFSPSFRAATRNPKECTVLSYGNRITRTHHRVPRFPALVKGGQNNNVDLLLFFHIIKLRQTNVMKYRRSETADTDAISTTTPEIVRTRQRQSEPAIPSQRRWMSSANLAP